MTAVVEFDWARWSIRYSELTPRVTEQHAKIFFEEAGLYCDNTETSPIINLVERQQLLGLVTAHLIALNVPPPGGEVSPLVGRITSASEGSVSVSVQNDYPPGSVQWFQQTRYGAQYWAATAKYRRFLYVAGVQPTFDRFQNRHG